MRPACTWPTSRPASGLAPWSYQVRLAYRTVGVAGFFYDVHQLNTVTGSWTNDRSAPR